MTTTRETVLAAAYTRLAAISSVSGLTVARNRAENLDAFPAIVMRDGGHQVSNEVAGYDLVTIAIEVELYARTASTSTNVGSLLNELYGAAKTALQADRTFGGVIYDVVETGMTDPAFDTSDASRTSASAVVSFDLQVWTPRDNPG